MIMMIIFKEVIDLSFQDKILKLLIFVISLYIFLAIGIHFDFVTEDFLNLGNLFAVSLGFCTGEFIMYLINKRK